LSSLCAWRTKYTIFSTLLADMCLSLSLVLSEVNNQAVLFYGLVELYLRVALIYRRRLGFFQSELTHVRTHVPLEIAQVSGLRQHRSTVVCQPLSRAVGV
jgi:hypothetical protein